MLDRWIQRIIAVSLVLLFALAGLAAYRVARANIRTQAYRHRLMELQQEHDTLRTQYNSAVKKTAVTELIAESGKLSVVIVTPEHELRRIETPFNPNDEIHVDFVVLDGRLWIRRIHDDKTPAANALLIDPTLNGVEWDAAGARHGLAIYRPLGEGRWVVNVTGNGALALNRAPDRNRIPLSPGPQVRAFDQVDLDVQKYVADVGFVETMRSFFWPAPITQGGETALFGL